jgi:hypothetical protein
MALPPEHVDRLIGGQSGHTRADFDFQSRLLLFVRPTFAFLHPHRIGLEPPDAGAGEGSYPGRKYTYLEYVRFADDLVILVDSFPRWEWLEKAAYKRLLEELGKLAVQVNREKTRVVDLTRDESFSFLGFDLRRMRTWRGKWGFESRHG